MKKISLFVVGLVAMLGFGTSALAADTVSLACTNKEIAPGESTTCTISINSTDKVTSTKFTLDTSKYLTVSNVKANSLWTDMKAVAPTYSFESATGTTGKAEVFSFTLTLSKEAANLPDGDCGQLCIDSAFFNDTTVPGQLTKGSTGTCFMPTIVEETPDVKNPETGAFANYAIILGVAAVAVGSIIVARKSNKFYRV